MEKLYISCVVQTKPNCTFFVADFCYGNEDLAFSISEAIKLCVTVVAYAPESFRRYGNTPRRHGGLPFPLPASSAPQQQSFFFLSVQSPDADGAGGPGPLPPPEAEEQHGHNGVRLGRQGRDRSHRRSGHIPAGPPLQLRGPHKVCNK